MPTTSNENKMSDRDLKALIESEIDSLSRNPETAQVRGQSTVTLRDGLACAITSGRWTLIADVPESAGGDDRGPDPGVLIRGALGSCLAMDIKTWAARLGVDINEIRIEVESKLNQCGMLGMDESIPPGYQKVSYKAHLTSEASEADLAQVLRQAERFNPRLHDLRSEIPLEGTLVIHRTETASAEA